MTEHECPHCGQPMLVRFGVRFPPAKARMLDMIMDVSKGRGEISQESLSWVFYPGVAKKTAMHRVAVHVNQINDLLAETDVRIVKTSHREGSYKIVEQENTHDW